MIASSSQLHSLLLCTCYIVGINLGMVRRHTLVILDACLLLSDDYKVVKVLLLHLSSRILYIYRERENPTPYVMLGNDQNLHANNPQLPCVTLNTIIMCELSKLTTRASLPAASSVYLATQSGGFCKIEASL